MKAQWVYNNEPVHMANHRLALPWECSQLLGVCNAKTSRWEVENSKRKEGLPSRALHPRDYFLLEIVSVLFTIFVNSGPQWIMWDTPLWSHCCYSCHQLMTFVWKRQGVRENCSPAPAACAVPLLLLLPTAAPHPLSVWGKRLLFLFANISWRPRWELKSSQSSSITVAEVTDTVLRRPELNWVSPLEKSKRSATAPTAVMYHGFF